MAHQTAATLLERLQTISTVELWDPTHGLFGDLYGPAPVWESLVEAASAAASSITTEDPNVGLPSCSPPGKGLFEVKSQSWGTTTFLKSPKWQEVTPHEMALEIQNTTISTTLRVRWISADGTNDPATHCWDILPSSTFEQYTKPGHLFLLSIIRNEEEEEEQILGAYRAKRALPSLTPIVLLVQDLNEEEEEKYGDDDDKIFVLETMLLDDSKFDAMSVAAADLDPLLSAANQTYHHSRSRTEQAHTIQLLKTIVDNLLQYPDNPKFHQLRLSNGKIQKHLATSWGAMELLRLIGFSKTTLSEKEEEDYLIFPTPCPQNTTDICQQALTFLETLQARAAPSACADLAGPTPWTMAMTTTNNNNNSNNWNNTHRGFVSAEERWARADRVASLRRSGRGRRPAPGEAPSSRGKWGR